LGARESTRGKMDACLEERKFEQEEGYKEKSDG